MEVDFMPIKIDVQTNINEYDLTIESCSEIIEMLQNSYKTIRKEMYNHFLSIKHLKKALIFVFILAFFYMITEDIFFIYFMPISVFLTMISSVISAEYLTSQTRKQISNQIEHFKKTKERLMRNQKVKA